MLFGSAAQEEPSSPFVRVVRALIPSDRRRKEARAVPRGRTQLILARNDYIVAVGL
jgi:hypothetical protein